MDPTPAQEPYPQEPCRCGKPLDWTRETVEQFARSGRAEVYCTHCGCWTEYRRWKPVKRV